MLSWQGRSVQCCTCSKWVHLECSLSFSRFRALGCSHSWSFPASSGNPTPYQHCDFSGSSILYTSTTRSGPPVLMQHSRPTFTFKRLISFSPTLCLLPLCPYHCLMLLAVSLHLLLPLFPDALRVLQWNAGVSESGALNFYTLFCLIPLTLFVSRNLTLAYLPLS